MPRRSRLPQALRPLVGGAVLVGTVRAIDAVWHGVTGRHPPTVQDGQAAPSSEARLLRDRLVYAALLGTALRIARRAGLADEDVSREDPRAE
jgi:hypothetical protein